MFSQPSAVRSTGKEVQKFEEGKSGGRSILNSQEISENK